MNGISLIVGWQETGFGWKRFHESLVTRQKNLCGSETVAGTRCISLYGSGERCHFRLGTTEINFRHKQTNKTYFSFSFSLIRPSVRPILVFCSTTPIRLWLDFVFSPRHRVRGAICVFDWRLVWRRLHRVPLSLSVICLGIYLDWLLMILPLLRPLATVTITNEWVINIVNVT